MIYKIKLSGKKIFSNFFYIIIFSVFLIPYSISTGLSANYSFILFPLLIILFSGKIKIPSKNIIIFILFFSFILLIGIIYQYELFIYLDRRLISFLIFMTMFSYVVIDIGKDKINSFKIAVVLIVLYFVILKIGNFFIYTEIGKGNLKYHVGNSRYGFVYLLAFWIVYFYKPRSKLVSILKTFAILLILGGIFITYSRTTILSFLFSFGLFYFSVLFKNDKKFYYKLFFFLLIPLILFVLLILLEKIFTNTYNYFSDTLFTYFSIDGLFGFFERLNDSKTSVGFRVLLLGKIIDYVSLNPFTGSGFLGCWIMFDDLKCSAHNQYADVLFRTGFVGFYIYLYILYKIFIYLRHNHQDLFYGFVSILLYGLFHETFKMSQGAFILSFMIGMMATSNRNLNLKFSRKRK